MRPIAAVLLIVVAACASPATEEPSVETSAEPSGLPSASSDPSQPLASLEWVLAESIGGDFLTVGDVTYGNGQYVAIGNDREAMPGQLFRGRVWISPDGNSWEVLPRDDVFSLAYLTDVVVAGDGSYLVFGHVEDATGAFVEMPLAVWQSADGRTWARADVGLPEDLSGTQVAAGPMGYLLSGIRGDRSELWLSADARTWEMVLALAPRTGPVFEDIQHVGAGTEGFVATGIREAAPLIVASGDGRAWLEATNPPAWTPIAPLQGDWVLAEVESESEGADIWFSANGLDWDQTAIVGTAGQHTELVSVLSAADQVFVTLATLGPHPGLLPAGVWASPDGTAWREQDLEVDDFITGAASSEETVVLVGERSFFVRLNAEP